MILTPCPYDPSKWGAGAMILKPCPYDPNKWGADAMILTPCPYDPNKWVAGTRTSCRSHARYCRRNKWGAAQSRDSAAKRMKDFPKNER